MKPAEDKNLQYSKLLEGVLQGISDIIGVYKPDHTIMFYNQSGYDFYKKNPNEVEGRKCYEMLGRKQKCLNCPGKKVIETKKTIKMEKFIPQFDRYMDCCYNPVMDDSGEVIFIVERLTDITEKRNLENILRESEESYRQIVDLSPDVIIITIDDKIVLANKQALKYNNSCIGESIYKFVAPDFVKTFEKSHRRILEDKKAKTLFDCKIIPDGNRVLDVELSSSYLSYKETAGVLSIIRDITERKKELNAAAKVQRQVLQKPFPIANKVGMETLYIPAKTVSGDFFCTHKVNENMAIGIIADVSGKGINAALNISAFNVLFHEAVLASHDPYEIINILNKKVVNYLGERYIAALCFSLDFVKNEAKVVGAGINQFIIKNRNNECEKIIVKGPFLGMFDNSIFDEQIVYFHSGDKFYFFSDGLDFLFTDDKIDESCIETTEIRELKNQLDSSLNDMLTDAGGIIDDCTLLALEIK